MSLAFKAVKAANSVSNFVTDVGETPVDADGTVEGGQTDEFHGSIRPGLMDLAAVGGFGASVASLMFTNSHLVDAASFTTAALAPYAAYQKHNLQRLGGFRGQQNSLRQHVNKLSDENTGLSTRVDKLETQVDKLEHVEEHLEKIAKEGQSTVNHLIDIQKRQTEINEKMHYVLGRRMLSILVGIILESDRDSNFRLSPPEIMMMKLRLQSVQGVTFHEDNFNKCLPEDQREHIELPEIMTIVWNLNDKSIPEEERVFTLNPIEMIKKM